MSCQFLHLSYCLLSFACCLPFIHCSDNGMSDNICGSSSEQLSQGFDNGNVTIYCHISYCHSQITNNLNYLLHFIIFMSQIGHYSLFKKQFVNSISLTKGNTMHRINVGYLEHRTNLLSYMSFSGPPSFTVQQVYNTFNEVLSNNLGVLSHQRSSLLPVQHWAIDFIYLFIYLFIYSFEYISHQ